jgi:putative flippase GtrA
LFSRLGEFGVEVHVASNKNWRGGLIAIRYASFAVIAVCANLGSQAFIDRKYPAASFAVSLIFGTAVGFTIKYTLDKLWIFDDKFELHPREVKKIAFYMMFGVLTTLIFWLFETFAWLIWHTYSIKYVGAVVGLTAGYLLKYLLDRNITFRKLM